MILSNFLEESPKKSNTLLVRLTNKKLTNKKLILIAIIIFGISSYALFRLTLPPLQSVVATRYSLPAGTRLTTADLVTVNIRANNNQTTELLPGFMIKLIPGQYLKQPTVVDAPLLVNAIEPHVLKQGALPPPPPSACILPKY